MNIIVCVLFCMNLEELEKQRDAFVHKLFWLGLKIAVIFAVPAVGAALLGKHFDAQSANEGRMFTIIFLVIAFIGSWIITIREFSKINKKIHTIESQIKVLKQEQKNV